MQLLWQKIVGRVSVLGFIVYLFIYFHSFIYYYYYLCIHFPLFLCTYVSDETVERVFTNQSFNLQKTIFIILLCL